MRGSAILVSCSCRWVGYRGLVFVISGERGDLGLAVVARLSYTDARRLGRWGLLPMMAQAVWMFATQGFGNLWPLGIGFFLVLANLPIATACLGAFFGR